jgi:serine protease Do
VHEVNTTLFGDLVERLRHGTVCIRPAGRGEAIGSGILHAPEGTVLTNAHVLRSRSGRAEPRVTVERWDGATFEATLRKIDHGRDLAMLDPGHEPGAASSDALSLGNSDAIRAGELAVAVGNPLGFRGAMSAGVFHAPGSPPGPGGRSWVQAALQLAPGNSGGPLADAEGRVVGLNAMVSGGIAYAEPRNPRVPRCVPR